MEMVARVTHRARGHLINQKTFVAAVCDRRFLVTEEADGAHRAPLQHL